MARFDLAVIGGGPGGYVGAIRAAQLGLKVCIIEREKLGGVCLNWGCIPTKALIKNAEVYSLIKQSEKYGINVQNISVDFKKNVKRSRDTSQRLSKGIEFLMKKNKIKHLNGFGRFTSKNSIEINGNDRASTVEADKIIIATGSEPSNLNNIKIDEQKIVTSTGALELKSVPKKVIVIGAGVIGLELGTVWRRLGSEVEVIEYLPRVLNGMDSEVSEKFHKILLQQGLKFKLEHSVEKTSLIKDKVHVEIKDLKTSKIDTIAVSYTHLTLPTNREV